MGIFFIIEGDSLGVACGPHFVAFFRIFYCFHYDIRKSVIVSGRVEKTVLAVSYYFCRAAGVCSDNEHRRQHIFHSDSAESLRFGAGETYIADSADLCQIVREIVNGDIADLVVFNIVAHSVEIGSRYSLVFIPS